MHPVSYSIIRYHPVWWVRHAFPPCGKPANLAEDDSLIHSKLWYLSYWIWSALSTVLRNSKCLVCNSVIKYTLNVVSLLHVPIYIVYWLYALLMKHKYLKFTRSICDALWWIVCHHNTMNTCYFRHWCCLDSQLLFLDASTHLYKRLCPSVGPSVRLSDSWSVRRTFGPSVTSFFFKQWIWLKEF